MKCAALLGLLMLSFVGCGNSQDSIDLSEYPEPSAFLRQEIVDRMAALEYQTDAALLDNMNRLAYIGEVAVPFLIEGLNDPHVRVRGSSAYILGLLQDQRTIPALKAALKDPNNEVRYEAATALGGMGDRDGYRVLVEGLMDPDIKNRFKANEALEMLTKLEFGYRHDDPPELRRAAALRWEAWVDRVSLDDR